MLPSPSELAYFLEVAQTLNLSRASERLGVSQPTLSLAIQRLERNLGAPLLVRSKAGVKLTQPGQRLIQSSRQLLEDWERLRLETSRNETEIQGRYILGCHPSVGLSTLPALLPRLKVDHPCLEISLVHDLSRKIIEEVISYKVDFGIVVNPWPHPDLVIQDLGSDEVLLWRSLKPSPLQDPKSKESILIYDPALAQSQALIQELPKHGLHFQRTMHSSSLEVIASLVSAGTGVGILPGRVAGRAGSGEKSLRPLLKKGPTYLDRHCLVYRRDAQNSKASRRLSRTLAELLSFSQA